MKSDPFAEHIITRKRKKYKFAWFDSLENSFWFARGGDANKFKQDLNNFFIKKQPLILEIAAGNAQFSLELAKRNKNCNFVAIDIKSDRLYTSSKQAFKEKVGNIAFVRTHINELPKIFEPQSVKTIWLTFPDPHPKKRNIKHRLTHPKFLRQYRNLLQKDGELKYKTDNLDLFHWSLEQFVAENWHIKKLSFDLHESNLPEDYKIKTHYETKFFDQGLNINYAEFMSNSNKSA